MKEIIKDYLELVKLRSVLLLTVTGIGGLVVAGGRETSLTHLLLLSMALVLSVSGANALSGYLDRDIDARMKRTRNRPIPAMRISTQNAVFTGITLLFSGSAIAAAIGFLPLLFTVAGASIYLLIYSSWLKRISPFNVLIGGFAGGAPVMGGWTAHTGAIEPGAVLLAGLVVIWIPHHIWSLALYHARDYREVSIPMLPAIVEPKLAARCIAITVIIMYAFSLLFFYYSPLGELYLFVALALGLIPMLYGIWLFMRPDNRRAWVLFKISSPYLAVLFMVMIIDRLLA